MHTALRKERRARARRFLAAGIRTMNQSDHQFAARIFAGTIAGSPIGARGALVPPKWFSMLAVGVLVLGAALGLAI